MSVALTYAATATVVETIANNTGSATSAHRQVTHDQFNSSAALSANTTPPATIVAAWEKALVDGAGVIDLTAMTGTNGAATTGTGLKVQVFKIKAKATNANAITITPGDTNAYNLLGAAFSIILQAGQEFMFYGNELAPDIAANACNIKLAGTGTQSVELVIVCG